MEEKRETGPKLGPDIYVHEDNGGESSQEIQMRAGQEMGNEAYLPSGITL